MKSNRRRWVEVFVVLAAIAIVATMAVPSFIRPRSRNALGASKSNLKNLGTALEMYSKDWENRYPSSLSGLIPNYLKVIPECPTAGTDTYSGSYHNGPVVSKDSLDCRTHRLYTDKLCTKKQRLVLSRLEELGKPGLSDKIVKDVGAVCPDGQPYTYHLVYANFYSYYCSGDNHSSYDIDSDYPKYDAVGGLVERQ